MITWLEEFTGRHAESGMVAIPMHAHASRMESPPPQTLRWLRCGFQDERVRFESDVESPRTTHAWSATFGACDDHLSTACTWDGQNLCVRTDPLGYCPLFYYVAGKTLGVARNLLDLLWLFGPLDYDLEALAVFLRCGFFLGEDTPFMAIRAFPPGGVLNWNGGAARMDRPTPRTAPTANGTAEAVDGYIHYAEQAIARRRPATSGAVVTLSGGHDSRLILLGLCDLGDQPRFCATAGSPRHAGYSADVLLSMKVAQRLGVPQRFFPSVDSWMAYDRRKNIATGFCTLEHTWMMPLAEGVHRSALELYEGTGVEVFTRTDLLTSSAIELYERGRFEQLAEHMFRLSVAPAEEFIARLPRHIPGRACRREAAVTRVARAFANLQDTPNPLGAFSFWHWNRRAIALSPLRHLTNRPRLHSPLLDVDLVRFVSGIPHDVIMQKEPQRAAIQKRFPRVADIPFNKEITLGTRAGGPGGRRGTALDRLLRCSSRSPAWIPVLLKAHASSRRNPQGARRMFALISYLSQLMWSGQHVRAMGR
jgi:asparagine synthase (glutamine-hydrolysing)